MRAFLFVALISMTACLQPLHRYALSPLMGSDDERTTALARAFVAAGAEPEVVDPRLGMVATAWQTPFGSSQGSTWTRRWVAVINPTGAITIRAEIKVCRVYQGCSDLNGEGSQPDLDALDAFVQGVGQSLGSTITVLP